ISFWSVAGAAGIQVVVPYEYLIGVNVFWKNMFHLVAYRIFTISTAPGAGTHLRECIFYCSECCVSLCVFPWKHVFGFSRFLFKIAGNVSLPNGQLIEY